ncbi:MAG: glycosyltransferase [Clostridia bacterium]|nr:glycosyltransferase [Clostridia bacterium]
MKITFFTSALSGGGAERVVCNLSSFLAVKGHDVTVLTVGESAKTYGLNERVKVLSLEGKSRIKFSALRALVKLKRLKKYVKNCKDDLIVAFLPKPIKALMHYKKFAKCPIILCERCFPKAYDKKTVKSMLNAFKSADGTVFQTEEIKKFYSDKIALKNSMVIPNAVNTGFDFQPFNGERRKVIVAAGRHSEQKNFELLIDAFSEVVKEFSDFTLEIYGKGKLTPKYIERCKELGIENKVLFPGFCEDMSVRLYGASLFVMSSDYEGIPNALIEAMAAYTPCVSTDCAGGGARTLIEDGVNGIIVPVGDKSALAKAIKRVLADKSFAEKLSLNAGKIKEEFSAENIYAEWEKYFSEIIKK